MLDRIGDQLGDEDVHDVEHVPTGPAVERLLDEAAGAGAAPHVLRQLRAGLVQDPLHHLEHACHRDDLVDQSPR